MDATEYNQHDLSTSKLTSLAFRELAGAKHLNAQQDAVLLKGKTVITLEGGYRRGQESVRLRGVTIKGARRKVAARQKRGEPSRPLPRSVISPAIARFAASVQDPLPVMEGGGDPGYDYYYTQGEMSKSDGTVLVNSAYQYNSESSQNVFTITLAGVTFSADLNTYELLQPVSDTQIEQVESWLRSDDGLLARQTSIALVEEGYQQPDNEALLIYYLNALAVGDDSAEEPPPNAALQDREERSHHSYAVIGNAFRQVGRFCSTRVSFSYGNHSIESSVPATSQCPGCCGPGCYCIPDLLGRPMYATPCRQHDACSGQYSRLNWRCLPSLWMSMQYVIFVRVSQR